MKVKNYLILTVIIAGLCSIVYELLVSATASYFLGDGVKQFSILIGVYLFSMGIGAYGSKFFTKNSLKTFIYLEYILGLIGGLSVPILYFLFVKVSPTSFQFYSMFIIFLIGLLTGAEVPLLTFAFENTQVKEKLSLILSLDYIGGLFATLLFPFILLPFVGLFYSSLLFGIINILLGLIVALFVLKLEKKFIWWGVASCGVLLTVVFYAGNLLNIWENKIYKHPVAFEKQTIYQKMVLTKNKHKDVRLYLNRAIQFSSLDEHRYHELLVHVPMCYKKDVKNVLILGGGENLASREVLKHSQVESIDVVDIDPDIFKLAQTNSDLLEINQGAANNEKVNLIANDAFNYLYRTEKRYDLIIADLPDPANESIARLYSKEFYSLVKRCLKPDGISVTQAGEIYFSNRTFSCIYNTIGSVFDYQKEYQVYIPSFGNWGFVIGANTELDNLSAEKLPLEKLKFLDKKELNYALTLPKDIEIQETKINKLDKPIILNYFSEDWQRWKIEFEAGSGSF
ncbi:polyamine aminopropyltransferase [Tenacibaculum sp. MEBiC06402]|uniref:polyamine aminopropyltransferase n=1 Tax=unclassified Tenacibaculum TaxID=2635139 RepID=UPI003B9DBEB4